MVRLNLSLAAVAAVLPLFTFAAPAAEIPSLNKNTHVLKERAPPKINHRNPYEATKVYRSTVPIEEQEAVAAAKRYVPVAASSPSPSPGVFKRSFPSPSPSPMARRTNLNERKVKADSNNIYANIPVFKREPTPTQEQEEAHEKRYMEPLPIASPGVISNPIHPVEQPVQGHPTEPSARPEASAEPNVYVKAEQRRKAQLMSPMGMLD